MATRAERKSWKEAQPRRNRLLKLDWDVIDKLLMDGCTGTEAAAYIGVSPEVLYHRCQKERGEVFALYAQQKRAKGDAVLKARQMAYAMTGEGGNAALLVWLGKNRLNQKENPTTAEDIPKPILELLSKLDNVKAEGDFKKGDVVEKKDPE